MQSPSSDIQDIPPRHNHLRLQCTDRFHLRCTARTRVHLHDLIIHTITDVESWDRRPSQQRLIDQPCPSSQPTGCQYNSSLAFCISISTPEQLLSCILHFYQCKESITFLSLSSARASSSSNLTRQIHFPRRIPPFSDLPDDQSRLLGGMWQRHHRNLILC